VRGRICMEVEEEDKENEDETKKNEKNITMKLLVTKKRTKMH
jgi:hypothetical protein